MTPRTFRCAHCGVEFTAELYEEAALEQLQRDFPEVSVFDSLEIVCRNCHDMTMLLRAALRERLAVPSRQPSQSGGDTIREAAERREAARLRAREAAEKREAARLRAREAQLRGALAELGVAQPEADARLAAWQQRQAWKQDGRLAQSIWDDQPMAVPPGVWEDERRWLFRKRLEQLHEAGLTHRELSRCTGLSAGHIGHRIRTQRNHEYWNGPLSPVQRYLAQQLEIAGLAEWIRAHAGNQEAKPAEAPP